MAILTLLGGSKVAYGTTMPVGTNISEGIEWGAFSIHTREDGGVWEDWLVSNGYKYMNRSDIKKSYEENAKIIMQTPSSFEMDVINTGWGVQNVDKISSPWGVAVSKKMYVERQRYYTIKFKIKSTLRNEIMESKERDDGTGYNVGTGIYNYIKHIYFEVYSEKEILPLLDFSAMAGTENRLVKNKAANTKYANSFIELDARDEDWVTIVANVLIPNEEQGYFSLGCNMEIKMALGSFKEEYPNEHAMQGTIQVKDFEVLAGKFERINDKSQQTITAKSKKVSYGTKSFNLNAITNGNGKLTYASSNSRVAVVNESGKVAIKGCGRTTITIKACETESYASAVKKITIEVVPKKVTIKKIKSPGKKKMTAVWKKVSGITGYQIYFSTRKNFKRGTYVRTYKMNKTKMNIIALKSKKTYYMKIRAYKKIGKEKYYGAWSKVRSVKIK